MPKPLPQSIILKIIKFILDGRTVKDIAYLLDLSADPIYDVRDKYFKQIWSLKKHPKETFKLEE